MDFYPKFIHPSLLIGRNYRINPVQLPSRPIKPTKEEVKDTRKSFLSTSVILIMIIGVIGFAEPSTFSLGAVGIVVLSLYKAFSYSAQSRAYENRKNSAETKYLDELSQYETEEKLYQEKLNLKKTIIGYWKEEEEEMARVLTLKKLYKEKGVELSDTNEVKEGVSEKSFFILLRAEFGNRIKKGKGVTAGEFGPKYLPDFIYYDNVRQIYIDIEIDEPYDLQTGLPIHCQGQDEKRDQFFLSINWCVVRFSEFQVVNDPDGCIKTLESIIQLLEDGLLEWTIYVAKDPGWDRDKAIEMEKSGYREEYLGIPKLERIKPKRNNELDIDEFLLEQESHDDTNYEEDADLPF